MKVEYTKTDCRVRKPVEAVKWMDEENARIKSSTNERVIPIVTVIEAILAAGLRTNDWQEIAREMAAQRKPLTRRGRQFSAQKK